MISLLSIPIVITSGLKRHTAATASLYLRAHVAVQAHTIERMATAAATKETNGNLPQETGLWSRNCEKDTTSPVEGVLKGTIPAWLNGRLIRNGPGERHIGADSYKHLFDGSSLLHMINIKEGMATYSSKFLESESYTTNHKMNRIVFSEFGTVALPDPCLSLYGKFKAWFIPNLREKETDNCLVNILQVKDQLLAMSEMNRVRIVDPETLNTLPEKLKYSKYVSVQRATAHPHVDSNQTVYNLGFDMSDGPMKYCIISLPEGKIENAQMEASVACRWKLSPSYMHSFGITENYFILVESPLCYDIVKMLLPRMIKSSPAESLKYHAKENMKFRIISRKTGKELKTNFLATDFFNFHFANCFESDGNIVMDLCKTTGNIIHSLTFDNIDKKNDDSSKIATHSYLTRYVLPVENLNDKPFDEDLLKNDPHASVGDQKSTLFASAIKQKNGDILATGVHICNDTSLELPRINYRYNMKPYTYIYASRVSDNLTKFFDFDSLVKVNVKTGETLIYEDKDYFCSEPVFISSPGVESEDDGVVLALLIHKTEVTKLSLLVLDAKVWEELARVDFEASGAVTSTFHGQFMANNDQYHHY